MKNVFVVSALAAAMMSGSALAAPITLNFNGTVSEVTCDLVAFVNGFQTNAVNLGTTRKNSVGEEQIIVLKQDPTVPACDFTGPPAVTRAQVTWTSAQFDNDGLAPIPGAASGSAMDARVLIESAAGEAINSGRTVIDHATPADVLSTGPGVTFKAKLQGKTMTGPFAATATVAVNYL